MLQSRITELEQQLEQAERGVALQAELDSLKTENEKLRAKVGGVTGSDSTQGGHKIDMLFFRISVKGQIINVFYYRFGIDFILLLLFLSYDYYLIYLLLLLILGLFYIMFIIFVSGEIKFVRGCSFDLIILTFNSNMVHPSDDLYKYTFSGLVMFICLLDSGLVMFICLLDSGLVMFICLLDSGLVMFICLIDSG